jgi:hypothetical protein
MGCDNRARPARAGAFAKRKGGSSFLLYMAQWQCSKGHAHTKTKLLKTAY